MLRKHRHFLIIAFAVIFAIFSTAVLLFIITPQDLTNVKAAGNTNLVVLGDSITNQGVVTTNGWVNLYSTDANSKLQTTSQIINLATNGIRSDELLSNILNNQSYQTQIASAQIVTVEIGYNDFLQARANYQNGTCGGTDNQDCLRVMVNNFNSNWDAIISEIKALTAANSTKIAYRDFDIYYSVAGVDQQQVAPYNGQFSVLNTYLTQMNSHIAQSSTQNGFLLGAVHQAYNGVDGTEDPIAKGYILPDAVHPTDLGHSVIANQMKSLGYSPLSTLDSDSDGFSDVLENYMGTDSYHACGANAWPPDFNNDGGVGLSSDLLAMLAHVGSRVGDAKYDKRYDLNGDGAIGLSTDVLIELQYLGKKCVPGT